MKRKKYTRVKGVVGHMFNIRKWGNFDDWGDIGREILETVKRLFIPQVPKKKERLKSVMKRLKLTEEEVQQRCRRFFFLAVFSFALGIIGLIYTGSMIGHGHYKAIPLAFTTSVIAFSFAFRYHFWYFQLKTGKLGCSIGEWLKNGFRRSR